MIAHRTLARPLLLVANKVPAAEPGRSLERPACSGVVWSNASCLRPVRINEPPPGHDWLAQRPAAVDDHARGGADILAGRGSLGLDGPRLCVQVKSQQDQPADVTVYRALKETMQTFGAEQGLLVCAGGFNRTVLREYTSLCACGTVVTS